jgi:16S rRNA processing protein RimM
LPEKTDRVLLGDIGAAQGLKGEVRIRSFTEDPTHIGAYGALEDETGARSIEIESLRLGPKGVVARIKGVVTRNAAEALTGTKLYVPRSRLPEREEDEWYYADLVGLVALDTHGAALGTVVAVHNFGAGDLLEIRTEASGTNVLVPFTRATVPEIDIETGRLVLDPPEGLFEAEGPPEE